jgi:response regulator of citrate/malate metabolism
MSRRSNTLVREANGLRESITHLRSVLEKYAKQNDRLRSRIQAGDHLGETLDQLQGAGTRLQMTEALEQFEVARHRVRLSMFALAEEQGMTISELARSLGISRQLASRLAAEADDKPWRTVKRAAR